MAAAAGWSEFAAALAIFFLSHMLPVRPPIRRQLQGALGKRGYLVLYSALSVAVLFWLIAAAGHAPRVQLWDFEPWQLWVPNIVMPFACLSLAYGIRTTGSFSIGGASGEAFDPLRPGIAGITRHPILWVVTLWAAAHCVPNGDLAHVILFGLFALLGFAAMLMLDRRKQREWGPKLWTQRAARTSLVPFAALAAGRFRGEGLQAKPIRIVAAVVLYLTLLLSHQAVIGVSPFPMA